MIKNMAFSPMKIPVCLFVAGSFAFLAGCEGCAEESRAQDTSAEDILQDPDAEMEGVEEDLPGEDAAGIQDVGDVSEISEDFVEVIEDRVDSEVPADTVEVEEAGCEAEIAALAALICHDVCAWTFTMRFAYTSLAPLGYQVIQGPYRPMLTEADARATAQADTGYGATDLMLNPANPEDEYVFYMEPLDFGGAAAVSADTGLTVFGGSIVWDGAGDINYPAVWRSPDELGENCPVAGTIASVRGYDLSSVTDLAAAEMDPVINVVLQTAVPAAILNVGYIFDAVVLLYPRSVGVFDPTTAEWIVFLNGGWLE